MKSTQQSGLSRRSFVTGLGAALAAPCIVPAPALGRDGNTAPSERIAIGLIGCGGQGRGVMGAAMQQRNTRVVAVADVNRRNLRKARRQVDTFYEDKSCRTYQDFRELLEKSGADTIIVGTPDHWHAIVCIEAAKAGKDIYCEKPLTWSLGEGRAVVEAVQANGVVLQVGSMQRSYGQMKKACELVRNGYLGKISHINVDLPNGGQAKWVASFPEPPASLDYEFYVGPAEWAPYHPERLDWNWRWWMGFGGGQMMDWIGHHGDIAHMGMGWDDTGPVAIEPVFWKLPKAKSNLYDGPESYKINYTYADGTTMQVASFNEMPEVYRKCEDTGTQWFGENGQWLFVSRGGMKANPESLLDTEFTDTDFRFRRQRNHMRDFLDCVKTRELPIAHVEAGHRAASIGHLGKIACMLECELKWDPAAEHFVGNPAVNRLLTRKYRGEWSLA